MKKVRIILCLLAPLIALASCAPEPKPMTEAARLASVLDRRIVYRYETPTKEQVERIIAEYVVPPEDGPPVFVNEWKAKIGSNDECLAAVTAMFAQLRKEYIGYERFGGDGRFLAAYKEACAYIAERPSPMTARELQACLLTPLSFVRDMHFRVGPSNTNDSLPTYIDDEHEFVPCDSGWALRWKGKLLPLDEEKHAEILALLKPSLNDEGEIVYRLVRRGALENSERLFELELDGEAIPMQMMYSVHIFHDWDGGIEFLAKDGISSLVIESCFAPEDPLGEKLAMLSEEILASESCIVDVRGNVGGWGWLLSPFLSALRGKGESYDEISNSISRSFFRSSDGPYELESLLAEYSLDQMPLEPGAEGNDPCARFGAFRESPSVVDNGKCLAILIDAGTASAAEAFAMKAKLLRRTLLVGMPTKGLIATAWAKRNQYPLNGEPLLQWTSPKSVNRYDAEDPFRREGIGVPPDLWVVPDKVKTRVLAFLKRYAKELDAYFAAKPEEVSVSEK